MSGSIFDLVDDEARMDRWDDEPTRERDDIPDRAELAGDQAEFNAWLEHYRAGRIRVASPIVGTLCERRPDERLSACVLAEGHEAGCVFVRLTRDRHGGAFYVIRPGQATPEQVYELRTRYREPTRTELANELEWLKVFRVIPATFDRPEDFHDRPF